MVIRLRTRTKTTLQEKAAGDKVPYNKRGNKTIREQRGYDTTKHFIKRSYREVPGSRGYMLAGVANILRRDGRLVRIFLG